ncbi:MAG: hypothetical protein AB1814_01975 [Thermodesulfobacteriota bacterium]
MTLIVGAFCSDGVVLGADGAATVSQQPGQVTARQTTKKLEIINNKIIVGISGPVGLGQILNGVIKDIWDCKLLSGKKLHEAMIILRDQISKPIRDALNICSAGKDALGFAALQSGLCHIALSLPLQNKPCLFSFDHLGMPEQLNEKIPFFAIGSGAQQADPFLPFLRRIFWPDSLPNLTDGIFAVLWTLDYVIKSSPGGVAEPKQVVILSREGNDLVARELPEREIQEHFESIKAAEQALTQFRNGFEEGPTTEPPTPE